MLSDGEAIASKPKYLVREAKLDELLAVMNINRICLPENYTYSFFYTVYQSYPRSFLVADTGSELAGYVMCRVERIFSKIEPLRLRRGGHIVSIAVLPNYRRLGIGRSLMLAALKSLKEEYSCDEAFLEVRVSNIAAIKLYESLGFKIVDTAKRYYVDGEDAYVMAKKL